MKSFYHSLGGTGWTVITPWNFTSVTGGDPEAINPCSSVPTWSGVTCVCDVNKCHLKTLILQQSSLQGTIPAVISKFSWLDTLDLSSNTIAGTVPATLWSMTALTSVVLESNNLKGCFNRF